MNRLYRLGACLLMLLMLTGTSGLYGDPLPSPNPFETADPGFWAFLSYCASWVYEEDLLHEPCQSPEVSFQTMRGDCDDFAVMIACFGEEAFHYDTFIISINVVASGKHAVAFVKASEAFKNQMAVYCGAYPYWIAGGQFYVPIDMPQSGGTCPVWTWLHTGRINTTKYEWDDLVGRDI